MTERVCAPRRVRGSTANFVKRGIPGTAELRRCLRQKQPKRSRGRGLLFASGLLPAQQKQGSATKGAERSEAEGENAGEVAQDAQVDCDGGGNKQCGGRLTPTPAEGPYLS